MTTLPVCRWRGAHPKAGHFSCRSPKLIVSAAGVTAEICQRCPYVDQEGTRRQPEPPRVQRPLVCVWLGPEVAGVKPLCWAQSVRQCEQGHGEVCHGRQCQTCTDYEPDGGE